MPFFSPCLVPTPSGSHRFTPPSPYPHNRFTPAAQSWPLAKRIRGHPPRRPPHATASSLPGPPGCPAPYAAYGGGAPIIRAGGRRGGVLTPRTSLKCCQPSRQNLQDVLRGVQHIWGGEGASCTQVLLTPALQNVPGRQQGGAGGLPSSPATQVGKGGGRGGHPSSPAPHMGKGGGAWGSTIDTP